MSKEPGIPGMDDHRSSAFVPQAQTPPQANVPPQQEPRLNSSIATTSEERNLAMIAHLGALLTIPLGGWMINIAVPLVIWLVRREQSEYVRRHAAEALNFQISLTIYAVVASVVIVVSAIMTLGVALLLWILLAIPIAIFLLVVMIKASIAASRGDYYRYPLTIRFVS